MSVFSIIILLLSALRSTQCQFESQFIYWAHLSHVSWIKVH